MLSIYLLTEIKLIMKKNLLKLDYSEYNDEPFGKQTLLIVKCNSKRMAKYLQKS